MGHVLQGQRRAGVCATAIEMGLLTRLDHAAYLGHELARAAHALRTGEPFVQDAAPREAPGPPPPDPPPSGRS